MMHYYNKYDEGIDIINDIYDNDLLLINKFTKDLKIFSDVDSCSLDFIYYLDKDVKQINFIDKDFKRFMLFELEHMEETQLNIYKLIKECKAG